ncbi:MAG: AIM24 family protein, partial [Anaerolineales bacterium]|nr:AIM24 family protein [Anaerolineales bacterium]
MEYQVKGNDLQMLEVRLAKGETVFTESGGMAWMSHGIGMETNTRGGLMSGLGRALAGESLFMTTYTCQAEKAFVVFTPEAPGKVLAFELQAGESLICQKDAFMFAEA